MDLAEFLGPFFEESFEMIDHMEGDLLALEAGGAADAERIHSIFRVAHSVKGGAATLGLGEVAEYTHLLETLLDAIREGQRPMTEATVKALLGAVDVMRDLLLAARDARPANEAAKQQSLALLKQLMNGEAEPAMPESGTAPLPAMQATEDVAESDVPGSEATPATPVAPSAPPAQTAAPHRPLGPGWRIYYNPRQTLGTGGAEPLFILREVRSLGEVEVRLLDDALPRVEDLNPRQEYLAWEIIVHGDIPREAVEEIFAWVMDQAEVTIEPLPMSLSDEEGGSAQPAEAVDQPDSDVPPQAEPAFEAEVQDWPLEEAPEQAPAPSPAAAEAISPPALATPATTPPKEAAAPVSGSGRAAAKEGGSIRVGIEKVDAIIDLVGELVITQSMLGQFSEEVERDGFHIGMLQRLRDGLAQLERNTRELQENVMRIRMLPISVAFNRFPRMVHDISRQLGKQVELRIFGENTELDKTVLEKIGDPLVHLVRNALDHGLETPEERRAAGKPEMGALTLNAYHKGGSIVIEISDDGRGINKERVLAKAREKGLVGPDEVPADERIFELIFAPGFSTAEAVTDLSGRGVGMDVVKSNIQALSGSLEIKSAPGKGTTFIIRLPLTLSIMDGQLIIAGGQIFILPLLSIVESLQIDPSLLSRVAGKAEVYRLREEYIPVIRLRDIFNLPEGRGNERPLLVVVEGDGVRVGLMIDDLLGQQQVVIKSLETHFRKIEGLSGSTILGDGTVALILDIGGIIQLGRRIEASRRGVA
ncbi:MAG: chemotaxis protein CheW [Pseudomonadota bacterium]